MHLLFFLSARETFCSFLSYIRVDNTPPKEDNEMRLRRRRNKSKRLNRDENDKTNALESKKKNEVKEAVPVKPVRSIKRLLSDPNFNIQIMTVLLTMTSDNARMDRSLETMTTTVDKVRNITELINNSMRSLKTAAEAPRQIKQLFK